MCRTFFIFAIVLSLVPRSIGQQSALYQIDFQQSEPGSAPADFKILSGEFAVEQDGSNRLMELKPTPLNSFGVLLGPEREAETTLRARIRSWPTGRRFPEFGVGLGGAGGYRLWLMPAINELQIRQGDRVMAKSPFTWKPGQWVHFQLHAGKTIEGKAWHEGDAEPADWMISHEPAEAIPTGRASLWGTPYSEKPVQFDDVRLTSP